MDIKTIKANINFLKNFYFSKDNNLLLRDKIVQAYTKRSIETLDQILSQNDKNLASLIEKINCFLKQNWDFVRATLLCYTALPDNKITHLLCDIVPVCC